MSDEEFFNDRCESRVRSESCMNCIIQLFCPVLRENWLVKAKQALNRNTAVPLSELSFQSKILYLRGQMFSFVLNLYSDLPSFEGGNSFVHSSEAVAPPTFLFEMGFCSFCVTARIWFLSTAQNNGMNTFHQILICYCYLNELLVWVHTSRDIIARDTWENMAEYVSTKLSKLSVFKPLLRPNFLRFALKLWGQKHCNEILGDSSSEYSVWERRQRMWAHPTSLFS